MITAQDMLAEVPVAQGWKIGGVRLEFHDDDDNTHKFYEILVGYHPGTEDVRTVNRWGRCGTVGQSKLNVHSNLPHAVTVAATQESRKTVKGYGKVWQTSSVPADVETLIALGINPYAGYMADPKITLEKVERTVNQAMQVGYNPDAKTEDVFHLKAQLSGDLADLRTVVHDLEASAEFADTFLTSKLQGVATGSNQ